MKKNNTTQNAIPLISSWVGCECVCVGVCPSNVTKPIYIVYVLSAISRMPRAASAFSEAFSGWALSEHLAVCGHSICVGLSYVKPKLPSMEMQSFTIKLRSLVRLYWAAGGVMDERRHACLRTSRGCPCRPRHAHLTLPSSSGFSAAHILMSAMAIYVAIYFSLCHRRW